MLLTNKLLAAQRVASQRVAQGTTYSVALPIVGRVLGRQVHGERERIALSIVIAQRGLPGLVDHLLSVDAVQRYKTDPAAYALGPQALGRSARQILFVSANGWDALGAAWYGYTTLWVNRQGAPAESLEPAPTRTGSSLREVLDFFPSVSLSPTPDP